MRKPDLIFRADGSSLIGLGHLVRSLALAQMLDSLFTIHFYSIEAPESFINEISSLNFYFDKIEVESDFIERIKHGDIVVLDHYKIDISIHIIIRAKGARLVCIDDLHDKPFDADLIINHAPGVEPSDYNSKSYTRFALGPNFALLRPEFLKAALERQKQDFNRRLLVCFGGSDFNNLTCQAIEALYKNSFFEEISVLTGVSFSNRQELYKLVNLDCRVKLFENQNAEEMLKNMQNCKFVLAPASSIAYEILSAGSIWLGGYYVENQKRIYEGFKQMNCLVDFGNLNKNLPFLLPEYNDMYPIDLNKNNPIDGKSNLRLKNIFSALC